MEKEERKKVCVLVRLGVWNLSVDGRVLPLFFPRGGTTLHRRPPPRCSPISPPGPPVTRGQYLCTLLTGMWIYARPLYYASCRPPCKTGMPGTVVPARHATRICILDERWTIGVSPVKRRIIDRDYRVIGVTWEREGRDFRSELTFQEVLFFECCDLEYFIFRKTTDRLMKYLVDGLRFYY